MDYTSRPLGTKNDELRAEAARVSGEHWGEKSHIVLYDYRPNDIEKLRRLNKEILERSDGKLVVAVLTDSSIRHHEKILQGWKIHVELLEPFR